jgi:hypothetical protein
MLDTIRQNLLAGALDAIGIWALLIALAAIGTAMMLLPTWRERALRARVRAGAAQLRRARYQAQIRCAQEMAAAATGATATAERHRAAWVAAHTTAEDAWQAFDAADLAAQRATQATAFLTESTGPSAAELVERATGVHRAATAAHDRGELSSQQLADIVAGRNGFDFSLTPGELDARLRLAIRGHLLHTYRQAVAAERAAWREADIAAAARSSLAVEALTAASRAEDSSQPHEIRIPRQRTAASIAPHPDAATSSGWSLLPVTR